MSSEQLREQKGTFASFRYVPVSLIVPEPPTNRAAIASCAIVQFNGHVIVPVVFRQQRAGITKRIASHSFRRTLATLLQSSGASVKTTQELLRRSSPVMTVLSGVGTDIVIRWMELQMSSGVGTDIPMCPLRGLFWTTTLVRPNLFR
jgi:hypothetical protein